MPSLLTKIELEVDALVEHIRELLTKNPNAEIHINAPTSPVLHVHPDGPGGTTTNNGHPKP